MRPTPFRLLAGAATVVLAVVGLTGCAPRGSVDGCIPQASEGGASAAVAVSGRFGAKPVVNFTTPLHTPRTEVSTVRPGRGTPIGSAQQVVADVTLLNATSGETFVSTEYAGLKSAATFVVGRLSLPGLAKALVCARPGERLVAVVPPNEGVPAGTRPDTLGATDSIVAVVDVRRAYLARADGRDQVMPGGLPAVVLGPDGRPGISLPDNDPPKALRVANLKTGSGAAVRRGDAVLVHYTGVVWKPGDPSNGTVFASTWTEQQPMTAVVAKGQQLVPGLVTALAGQRVGSQVLAVIPPAQGFGSQSTSGVPDGATVVYVVDVLGKV